MTSCKERKHVGAYLHIEQVFSELKNITSSAPHPPLSPFWLKPYGMSHQVLSELENIISRPNCFQ